jgi:hypothetical protein
MGEDRRVVRMLTGTPTDKRPSIRPWHRWEVSIRMYLKEIDINSRNWDDSAHDRDYWRALVNAALNLLSHVVSQLNLQELDF